MRTTQIITDLENSPRGLYTGCIGFIAPERLAQFNVAIRTAVVDRHRGQLEYGTGGGIVWDSTSEDEYTEALLKARVLTERYPEFSLLETMLWNPEDHYFLIDEHMNRLSRSATYFNFSLNLVDVERRLENLAGSFGRTPHRVRLLVSRTGDVHVEAKALEVSGKNRPFRIGLARSPVNSANNFLYHKTTRRRVYEDARKGCTECDDVLLWNEREEVTESCLANIVFDMDGELCTPPVKSGLLAGTFRERLLAEGRIRERLLPVAELKQCRKLHLINSVRKWQDAVLI